MPASGWEIASAVATSVAAAIAAFQLGWSRADANKRQTISLLQDIGLKLDAVNGLDLDVVRAGIVRSYIDRAPLSAEGATYLSFVHAIELLADARLHGGVDNSMTDRFLRGLVRNDTIPLSFLDALQKELDDEEAYSKTRSLLSQFREPSDAQRVLNG